MVKTPNMGDIMKFGIGGLVIGLAGALAYSKFAGPVNLSKAMKARAMYNVMNPPLIRKQYPKISGNIPIEYQPEDPDVTWTMPDWNVYVEPVENVIYNKVGYVPISARPAPDFRGIQPVGSIDKYIPGRTTYF
jgi:hypothetical protein